MRLISVVICGLFYSALANDDKQPKSILLFFFFVVVIHLLKLLFFLDIGIFNVVRFPNAACVGSNGNVSISKIYLILRTHLVLTKLLSRF